MKSLVKLSIILLVALFAFQPAMVDGQFFFFENPLLGEEAPDFTLPLVNGEEANLTELRDESNAIVFFWATWCPYCPKHLSELNANIADFKEKNIKIIVVNVGESKRVVEKFLTKRKITLDSFLDKDNVLAEEYGVYGLPTFVYINKQGIVKAVENEFIENYEEIFAEG